MPAAVHLHERSGRKPQKVEECTVKVGRNTTSTVNIFVCLFCLQQSSLSLLHVLWFHDDDEFVKTYDKLLSPSHI